MTRTPTRENATDAKSPPLPPSVSPEVIIRCIGLTKKFGDETVVQDVTFEIPRGKIFGFIGPSGSGKTTTVRLLTGILEPTAGQVTVLGHNPTKFRRRHREQIGYMPQLFVLYPTLTVWENLNFAASIYGMGLVRGKRLNEVLEFVELREHRHKLARDISAGMQRRLSLASTLLHDPQLIFLDEPTAGIDPVLRRKFWDHFKNLQGMDRTLFITTQYVSEAAYCDLVGVMSEGRLLFVESPIGLRRKAYGGDTIELKTAQYLEFAQVQQMQTLPFIRGRIQRLEQHGLRITVDDASTALPSLLEWLKQQNIAVESATEYVPPYDDVFVDLLKKEPRRG